MARFLLRQYPPPSESPQVATPGLRSSRLTGSRAQIYRLVRAEEIAQINEGKVEPDTDLLDELVLLG